MQVVGVVAEYNPFHLGHLYHLNNIKYGLNADAIICVMSGNFVQRGEPAVFNKWARAQMALAGGADLILELPVCFSTATAEVFAQSAIQLLYQTNSVNYISFGVEEGGQEALMPLGKLLAQEPYGLKQLLKSHLNDGVAFAVAREKAIIEYLSHRNFPLDPELLSQLMKKPNFILALEYVKAIHRIGASIKIYPVVRQGAQYHDKSMDTKCPSATAIREALKSGWEYIDIMSKSLPKSSIDIIRREIENHRGPVFLANFQKMLLYILRRMSLKDMRAYFDVGEGLEHRIKRAAQAGDIDQVISQIKTKRYPEARIKRIILHMLLDIPNSMVDSRTPLYFRVLGFTDRGAKLLRNIKKESTTPLLTRASDYKSLSGNAKNMFERDLFSAQVYSLAYTDSKNREGCEEFRKKVIHSTFDR